MQDSITANECFRFEPPHFTLRATCRAFYGLIRILLVVFLCQPAARASAVPGHTAGSPHAVAPAMTSSPTTRPAVPDLHSPLLGRTASHPAWNLSVLLPFLVGTAAWGLNRLRIRIAVRELQGRLEERLDERERIARELHDTLLQGLFGLSLRLQAAVNQLADDNPVRSEITRALSHSDAIMQDGRERIKNLRGQRSESTTLLEALDMLGQDLQSISAAQFHLSADGSPKTLNPCAQEEITFIVREALSNAFRHSNASTIAVEVSFKPSHLRLRVHDNGVGIAHALLQSGGRENHWGLASMRERAGKLRGQLRLENRSKGGTQVDLHVPASIAYKPGPAGENRRTVPTRGIWSPGEAKPRDITSVSRDPGISGGIRLSA